MSDKPRLSGWCSGPLGARTKCEGCTVDTCQHACHLDLNEALTFGKEDA